MSAQRTGSPAPHGGPPASPRNPPTTEFEFLGPYAGPIGMLFGLPLLTWVSAFYLRDYARWTTFPTAGSFSWDDVAGSFSWDASAVYVAWVAGQAALYRLVPGPEVHGTRLRDGTRLSYPANGFSCLVLTALAATAGHVSGFAPLTWVADNLLQLVSAAIAFSFALSAYLYAASFWGEPLLAANSGVAVYDFFLGRELNPRALGVDLKYFFELRPGLFAWLLVAWAALLKEVEARGDGALPSPAMAVAVALQTLYVCDALWSEASILTTMDIVMDGFGFMLAFGDLAWVPAMYSLQPRFLAHAAAAGGAAAPGAAFALAGAVAGVAGFYVFRAANAQKDTFKTDPTHPSVAGLPAIEHANGRLLAGGWWGVARHVNYAGDLLLALGMSLCTGLATPVPYFYPVYFAVLLWHRELRDDHKCAASKFFRARARARPNAPEKITPLTTNTRTIIKQSTERRGKSTRSECRTRSSQGCTET